MKYQFYLEALGERLRAARLAKGWSQRELSAKSGLTQANISKIETGQVDMQISSLLELARFLDLELTLAPRQATPAIEAIVRDTTAALAPPRVVNDIARISEASRALSQSVQGALAEADAGVRETAERLADQIAPLNRAMSSFKAPFAARELARIADQVASAQKVLANPAVQAQLEFVQKNAKSIDAAIKRVSEATRALAALRNAALHSAPDDMRPAYTLDDDEHA